MYFLDKIPKYSYVFCVLQNDYFFLFSGHSNMFIDSASLWVNGR